MKTQYWIQEQAPAGNFFDSVGLSDNETKESAVVRFESWKKSFTTRTFRLIERHDEEVIDRESKIESLKRQRDELVKALRDLETIAGLINGRQHAGCDVRPHDWSELFHCCNVSKATLKSVEGK